MAGIGIAKKGLGLLAKGGRAGFKKGKAVTKSDLAKRKLWKLRELKKRASKGHPLNPLTRHADIKTREPWRMRSDVYTRTRDEMKKDSATKGVGEAFQKMDWKAEKRNDPRYVPGSKFYKEHSPKLTKQVHVGRKIGGRI
jgi:hypothetical protein